MLKYVYPVIVNPVHLLIQHSYFRTSSLSLQSVRSCQAPGFQHQYQHCWILQGHVDEWFVQLLEMATSISESSLFASLEQRIITLKCKRCLSVWEPQSEGIWGKADDWSKWVNSYGTYEEAVSSTHIGNPYWGDGYRIYSYEINSYEINFHKINPFLISTYKTEAIMVLEVQ